MSRTAFRAGSTVRRSNLSDRRIAGNSRATSTELVARLSGVTSRWSTRVLEARQDPCRGTVVSLSLDPGHAQHPRWDDAADRDGTVTGVRCARRAPFRGRRCSWSPDVTSSSCARLFLPRRRFSGLGGHQFQLRIAASFLAGASGGLVLPGPHCAPAPPVTGDTSVGARLRSADRGDEPRMNGRAVLEVRGCATVTA
jgi:hypothetical protein